MQHKKVECIITPIRYQVEKNRMSVHSSTFFRTNISTSSLLAQPSDVDVWIHAASANERGQPTNNPQNGIHCKKAVFIGCEMY
mgnify:CR=1 FL=1